MNNEQTNMIVATEDDAIYTNIVAKREEDLDDLYSLGSLKECVFDEDDKTFYLIANSFKGLYGTFIFNLKSYDPSNYRLIYANSHRLEIDNVGLFIMRNKEKLTKELVVSYKSIYMNTHTTLLLDIASKHTMKLVFKFDCYQLWEQRISNLVIKGSKDFISVSNNGIFVLALGSMDKRAIKDRNGKEKMIHSLESYNYLKVADSNYLSFDC